VTRPIYIALIELKRYLADRGDLAFSLALPIVLFALMYAAFGQDIQFSGTAHIIDQDRAQRSRDLVSRLKQSDVVDVELHTLEDADDALDRSAILSAIVIPAGFTSALDAGEPVALTFKRRGSGGDEGQIVASIVSSVARDMAGQAQTRRMVRDELEDSIAADAEIDRKLASLFDQARETPPVAVEIRTIGGSVDFVDRMLPGIVVMFLLFAVTLGAQTLVEERRTGTLERLMTTRLGVNQLFAGKFLASLARATLQALILLSLGFAILRVAGPWVFVQIMIFILFVAAAVSAVGLVIGAVARTRDQAAWFAVFFTMFMTIFGGTFFDVGDTGPLAVLSKITLNRYAIDAMVAILGEEEGILQQGLGMAVLGGVAVVGLVAARFAFKTTEGGR
tara:strand:+ start:2402 stop:3580 length:1179 start_codon:yes stop_codon:yes gene_type:complete